MKLQNKELPDLLRREIFHQIGVSDPGGGICTSLDGQTVYYGNDDSHEDRLIVALVDAYNTLNIKNFQAPRRGTQRSSVKRGRK